MSSLLPRTSVRFFYVILLVLMAAGSACAYGLSHLPLRHGPRPLIVGYFSNSTIYSASPFFVKNLVTSGSAARLDQINYASASVTNARCSLADPEADLETDFTAADSVDGTADDASSGFRGYFHQLEELKHKYPHLKVLISLEGRASDFAIAAQPENRVQFVRSCVDLYLRGRFAEGTEEPGIFDGVDIDWESPHLDDGPNFRALIEEFRRQMNAVRRGLRLSVAVDQSPAMLPGTDFAALAPLVDEFGIMNYDYAGPWSTTTGFLAPLFPDTVRPQQADSIQSSIAAYKATGIPARKLLMGLPFYGYGWTGVSGLNHGLFQTGKALHGDHPYRSIRTMALSSPVFRDPRSRAPWIFDGENFWTYEDAVSVRYKVSYASRQGMGGVMIWELSGDTGDGELLNSAWHSLHHPLGARVFARAMKTPPKRSAVVAQKELGDTFSPRRRALAPRTTGKD
jgi:chitinase